jgi:type IV pilus assembly protein PilC
MDFAYVAYTEDRRLLKGKVSATDEEAAAGLLAYGGYQVVSLKPVVPFLDKEKLLGRFHRIKPREIIMFSRQLAILLESGTDIVNSLDLLQSQIVNPTLQSVIQEVASAIRGGSSLSAALAKHPGAFPEIYHRTVAAGEQGGNLEIVLRQMADYLERGAITEKKIKAALTYPVIVAVVAIVVVSILVAFVLPTFTALITAMGAELPLPTRILMAITGWLTAYGFILLGAMLLAGLSVWIYTRSPAGKYQRDRLLLGAPVVGRILLLSELSRCCRSMILLFKVGLPLPEIMAMAIRIANNKAIVEALTGVQQELIRGEGLSAPMAKRKLFLPLMVQMAKVGEATGNLDHTLATVAQSFEVEADDRTSAAVGLIQPAMTIIIGLIVAFIALALISAMFAMYAEIGL